MAYIRLSFFILFYLTILPFNLLSQNFTITSSTEPFGDLTAKIEARVDLNGEKCGLVKVRCVLDDVEFKGDIIGSVDKLDGEYRVYLINGTKSFSVHHPRLLPLDIDIEQLFSAPIHSNKTYVISLSIPDALYTSVVNQHDDYKHQSNSNITETTTSGEESGIDMGGSVLWAPYNLGATNDLDIGTLFKHSYYSTTSIDKDLINRGIQKLKDISGSSDDPVRQKLGTEWRLPTPEEVYELINKCQWEWIKTSTKEGLQATASNGNTLFFPKCVFDNIENGNSPGYSVYNIGALSTQTLMPYSFSFRNGFKKPYISDKWSFYEYAVRPVKEKSKGMSNEYVRFIIRPQIINKHKKLSGRNMSAFVDGKLVGHFANEIEGLEIVIPMGKHKLEFNYDQSLSMMLGIKDERPNPDWPSFMIDTSESRTFVESVVISDDGSFF